MLRIFELPFETNGNQPEAPFDDIVMHSHREGKSAVVFLLFYRNCYHLFWLMGLALFEVLLNNPHRTGQGMTRHKNFMTPPTPQQQR